ncbi:MAG: DUF4199 domain-containing protein [bacterium]
MKKTVWTFGLISGAILSAMMLATMPFQDRIGDKGEVVGYTTMVLSFLLIYFGVRSYRDLTGGNLSFGRALAVGLMITAVSSACYVATWEIMYYSKLAPDFLAQYQAQTIEKAKAGGASQADIDKKLADMKKWAELYKNPIINSAITFLEPLPVGVVIALVTAGVLRTRRRKEEESLAVA